MKADKGKVGVLAKKVMGIIKKHRLSTSKKYMEFRRQNPKLSLPNALTVKRNFEEHHWDW